MCTTTLKIADKVFFVNTQYDYAAKLCLAFSSDDFPDEWIAISKDDLEFERSKIDNAVADFNVDERILEVSSLHRKITEKLLSSDTILLHGSAILVDGEVVIFTAPSGTGKSTHIYKWVLKHPGVKIINADKPYIHIDKASDARIVYGSPWAGKESIYTNTSARLRAIVLMNRSDSNNEMNEITFAEAFPFLFHQVYWPDDIDLQRKTIDLLRCLANGVSYYSFHFDNFKDDCFQVAYDALYG